MSTKSTEKPKVGGWILILKSGSYEGQTYTKGKYYPVKAYTGGVHVHIIGNEGLETMVCIEPDTSYGEEGRYVGMKKPPEIITNYPIY